MNNNEIKKVITKIHSRLAAARFLSILNETGGRTQASRSETEQLDMIQHDATTGQRWSGEMLSSGRRHTPKAEACRTLLSRVTFDVVRAVSDC